ncbi:hypothetical protein PROFUN_10742 [Planoprotostelium fungivorum]|uniref:PPM-type phosphatase domain-containing protein n=1 Tax=Planoprotostelium fungivorum TaxID=1890364 RepID=A0A2P6N7Y8_9EUKA|nr:hypothetical protein PROFUN_10742 [Planoprotostelium fungivorum]
MEDGPARPAAPARQPRPERKGGRVMEAMKTQFLSLRTNRAQDEYESYDLPALVAEKDRLERKIIEAKLDDRGSKKIGQLETSLQTVNSQIAAKSPNAEEVITQRERKTFSNVTSTSSSNLNSPKDDPKKEKGGFSLRKPLMDFFTRTKRIGKKSNSAPASNVVSPEAHSTPTSPDVEPTEKRLSKSSQHSSPFGTMKTHGSSAGSSPKSTSRFVSLRGNKGKMEDEDLSKMFSKTGNNGAITLGRKAGKNVRLLDSAPIEKREVVAAQDKDKLPANFGLNNVDADALLKSLETNTTSLDLESEPDKYGTINSRRINITNFFGGPASPSSSVVEERSLSTMITNGVVVEYAVKTELNPGGLKRAKKEKKEFIVDGKRKMQFQNEDEYVTMCPFYEEGDQAFFSVCDGHADRNAAEAARRLLPEKFHKKLDSLKRPYELNDIFQQTFLEVDEELSTYQFEGTTATVVFFWTHEGQRYVQAANVGDSSAILCREGKAIELTFDHKMKDNPQELKRLRDMGIEISDNQSRLHGLAICRVLGDHCMKKPGEKTGVIADPFISPVVPISPGDTLILASDGLWDVMTFEKAAEMVNGMSNTSDMVRKLMNTALGSSECRDNVTIICSAL